MSEDINVTDGTVLEALNNKVDLDGGNYIGSGLDKIIHEHCGGLEIGDIGFTQMAIDETKGKRRILNGQLIIQEQYVQFTNIIKNSVALNPDLACTEEEWQTAVTMSANGVCYKFVIDDEAGTIRLPKYPEYFDIGIDGTKTVAVYGNGKTLSLTNGEQNIGLITYSAGVLGGLTGCYNKPIGTGNSGNWNANQKSFGVTTNSSQSGLTGSVDVESEKIKGQYFIQVATGAETEDNIINEIELNNPFSLLDYKYSEYELNNISWLRSNGQWNAKAIYPAVYDLLLKIYNGTETKAGVSVKLATEAFTDYDFVLNTTDETFRLPIKVKLVGGGKARVMNPANTVFRSTPILYKSTTGEPAQRSYSIQVGDGNAANIYSSGDDATKDYDTKLYTDLSSSDNSDLYLYFYVGETVQNANLINAGRIEEKVADLIPNNSDLITGFCCPDWDNAISFNYSTTTFTAPQNGYFVLVTSPLNSNGGVELRIYINGVQVVYTNTQVASWNRFSSCFIPVSKGDVITQNDNTNPGPDFLFVPMKGAK